MAEAPQILRHGLGLGFRRGHDQGEFAVHGRVRERGGEQQALGGAPQIAEVATALTLRMLERLLEVWQEGQPGRIEDEALVPVIMGLAHAGLRSSRTRRASLAAQCSASFNVRPQALGKLSPAA